MLSKAAYQAHLPKPWQHSEARIPPSAHIAQQLEVLELDGLTVFLEPPFLIPVVDDGFEHFLAVAGPSDGSYYLGSKGNRVLFFTFRVWQFLWVVQISDYHLAQKVDVSRVDDSCDSTWVLCVDMWRFRVQIRCNWSLSLWVRALDDSYSWKGLG